MEKDSGRKTMAHYLENEKETRKEMKTESSSVN